MLNLLINGISYAKIESLNKKVKKTVFRALIKIFSYASQRKWLSMCASDFKFLIALLLEQ